MLAKTKEARVKISLCHFRVPYCPCRTCYNNTDYVRSFRNSHLPLPDLDSSLILGVESKRQKISNISQALRPSEKKKTTLHALHVKLEQKTFPHVQTNIHTDPVPADQPLSPGALPDPLGVSEAASTPGRAGISPGS
ncbi:hypothetical protein BaRGS_00015231 [Batillaria attramentaria]|uniref:Transposase n=1 Tax=Batillaria attramentaria TaxID=370345 RepID=A0ABD0L223_9CAEN